MRWGRVRLRRRTSRPTPAPSGLGLPCPVTWQYKRPGEQFASGHSHPVTSTASTIAHLVDRPLGQQRPQPIGVNDPGVERIV
jgi:hypothetical protein